MSHERDSFWRALSALEVEAAPRHERAALARAWSESGQMEHASVASFNRFALQLLALGAPPELVEASQLAALDEIQHARVCFALASRYAGDAIGPGPLDLAGDVVGPLDAGAVVAATIEEGCIGETIAALEAEAARDAAREPAARAAWSLIAVDEARHAELAWTFVRWAIEGAPELAARARAVFEAGLARLEHEPLLETVLDSALVAQGRLGAAERQALRRRAVREVLRPALQSLLA